MAGIVPSRLGLFWGEQYKKELLEELKELIEKMEKTDTTEIVDLVPKAVSLLLKLYDWATAGENDDYQILASLISEVAKGHLELDQDDIEKMIKELRSKLY